jgi:hypothetical protein
MTGVAPLRAGTSACGFREFFDGIPQHQNEHGQQPLLVVGRRQQIRNTSHIQVAMRFAQASKRGHADSQKPDALPVFSRAGLENPPGMGGHGIVCQIPQCRADSLPL